MLTSRIKKWKDCGVLDKCSNGNELVTLIESVEGMSMSAFEGLFSLMQESNVIKKCTNCTDIAFVIKSLEKVFCQGKVNKEIVAGILGELKKRNYWLS
tara:strand:- start:3551 stop:3844 length:294 start_codon:yes stop_codon:yes gene_type:complete